MSDFSKLPPVDARLLIAFFGGALIVFGLGRLVAATVFKLDGVSGSIFALGSIFSNNVMLGLPLAKATLGDAAVPSVALVLVFNALILWTLVTVSIEWARHGEFSVKGFAKTARSVVTNPIVAAIVSGTLYGLTGWPLPNLVAQPLAMVGSAATPMALAVLGMGLAEYSVREGVMQSLAVCPDEARRAAAGRMGAGGSARFADNGDAGCGVALVDGDGGECVSHVASVSGLRGADGGRNGAFYRAGGRNDAGGADADCGGRLIGTRLSAGVFMNEKILVVDIESIRVDERHEAAASPEIIEIGAAWIAPEGRILATFRSFVRPLEQPRLTAATLRETGISQAEVDAAPRFPMVSAQLGIFVRQHATPASHWLTWGTTGPRRLVQECLRHKVGTPLGLPHMKRQAVVRQAPAADEGGRLAQGVRARPARRSAWRASSRAQ